MKILHAVPAYHPEGPGGIEVYTRSLVRAQSLSGHEPVVLSGCAERWPRTGVESGEVDGIRVLRLHRDDLYFHHYAKAYHPGVEELLERILNEERPDLLHVHHWLRLTGNLVEIANRCHVPAVVTLHDVYSSCPRCWRIRRDDSACSLPLSAANCLDCVPRWGSETQPEIAEGIELFGETFRHELTRAHAVLVSSGATGDMVAKTLQLDPATFTKLPLGYARRSPTSLVGPPHPGSHEPLRIAHWGNLGRHKGVANLVRAVREIVDSGQPTAPFELHVLGPAESPAFLLELQRLAHGAPVVFHGWYTFDDLIRLRPHLGVFPSTAFETFSFALEECFELGLPCIVSDLGALPERAGASALVVPHGDASALAKAIHGLLCDTALYERLAAQIPTLSPSIEQHSAALDRVYASAIGCAAPEGMPPVPQRRWAKFLLQQRESAQGKICPEGGPQ